MNNAASHLSLRGEQAHTRALQVCASSPIDNRKPRNQNNRSGLPASSKVVRQTVGLPAVTARHARSLAKQRRLSANRIIVELVEEGIEAQKRKQKEFFELAERYRAATDPKDVARLGDDLGGMVFGD